MVPTPHLAVDALHVHSAGTLSALIGGSALTLCMTGSENTCLTSWVPWLTLSGLTHECMVGVDGTNPSPCLLLQGAAILGLNYPASLAPTTAGLSTHESEPDPQHWPRRLLLLPEGAVQL